MIPVCVAIHDLCCYAKSSLTVVIPTLEALGVEVAPLPSALLSTQTDGFDSYYFEHTHQAMVGVLDSWKSLALDFDAIYTGFLGSSMQVHSIEQFIASQRSNHSPLVVIDPVLGDDGKTYGPVDDAMVKAMRSLVCHADVITPNCTEAAILLDRELPSMFTGELALQWAGQLSSMTKASVIITSVQCEQGSAVAFHHEGKGSLINYEKLSYSYPGSGDLFASILTGLLLGKESFQTAVEETVRLSTLALQRTHQSGYPRRHGIAPSLIMDELVKDRKPYVS